MSAREHASSSGCAIVKASLLLSVLFAASWSLGARGDGAPARVNDQAEPQQALTGEGDVLSATSRVEAAKRLLRLAARYACVASGCSVVDVTREELIPGIAHYSILLAVGPGEYDLIAVHRVIEEHSPGVPTQSDDNLFMIHGDWWDFESAFLTPALSGAQPAEQAMPVYLAQNAIDVWGIDLRFHHVPSGLPDYSFMAEQDMDTMMADARIAITLARRARFLTGQGYGRINVLGWGRGAWLAYALANAEAAQPPWKRHIGGLIPVDAPYKIDPNDSYSSELWCPPDSFWSLIETGVYETDASAIALVGELALSAPDDDSLFISGMTN